MHRRVSSLGRIGADQRATILEVAAYHGASVSSMQGLEPVIKEAKKKLGIVIDKKLLLCLLRPATVTTVEGISEEDKNRILAEASKLNGDRDSHEGFRRIRCFAARECELLITASVLRNLLTTEVTQRGHKSPPRKTFLHPALY